MGSPDLRPKITAVILALAGGWASEERRGCGQTAEVELLFEPLLCDVSVLIFKVLENGVDITGSWKLGISQLISLGYLSIL